MKNKPDTELSCVHIADYLMLSIIAIILDEKKQNIEYFSKTIPYKEEVFKYFKELNFQFTYTYPEFKSKVQFLNF